MHAAAAPVRVAAPPPPHSHCFEESGPPIGAGSEKLHTKRQVKGAAVAGGVTGLVLLGPAAGLLAAGGAALATTKGRGKLGRAARATGDSVSDLGRSAKKFDQKHGVREKTSRGIAKGCDWISKKLDKGKEATRKPY